MQLPNPQNQPPGRRHTSLPHPDPAILELWLPLWTGIWLSWRTTTPRSRVRGRGGVACFLVAGFWAGGRPGQLRPGCEGGRAPDRRRSERAAASSGCAAARKSSSSACLCLPVTADPRAAPVSSVRWCGLAVRRRVPGVRPCGGFGDRGRSGEPVGRSAALPNASGSSRQGRFMAMLHRPATARRARRVIRLRLVAQQARVPPPAQPWGAHRGRWPSPPMRRSGHPAGVRKLASRAQLHDRCGAMVRSSS
jgi:hypothetical protein